jgi:hypothetical protein
MNHKNPWQWTPGVQRLAVFSALRIRWIKLTKERYEDQRATTLEKLDLPPFATLNEARDRIIDLAREHGLTEPEVMKLERTLTDPDRGPRRMTQ